MITFNFKSLLYLIPLLLMCHCERIAKRIYEPVDGGLACFRRFNGTHQFGCSSGASGNVGVIHQLESMEDVDWISKIGPHAPYIAMLRPSLFNKEMMTAIKVSGKFNGAIVLNSTSDQKPERFSIDDSCPNRHTSFYAKHEEEASFCSKAPWNPESTEFLFEDWKFPVFFIGLNATSSDIQRCFAKYNKPIDGKPRDWPLCAVELKSPMIGAVNTQTCLRRGILDSYTNPQPSSFCDPLGDKNIFATLLPTNASEDSVKNRSLIVISTRIDSMSLFEDMVPAADSAITSLAALLSVADLIGRAKNQLTSSLLDDVSNIVFSLFNGEAFDYIGSSRAVYDMKRGDFPRPVQEGVNIPAAVGLHHVKYFIELEQIGSTATDQEYFVHSDPISQKDPDVKSEVERIKNALVSSAEGVKLKNVESGRPLPPASFQSFLKHDDRIPGVVVTNHEKAFTNKYYNSEYDTAESIGFTTNKNALVKNIAALSSAVGNTVYKLATGQAIPASIKVDEIFVGEVLECFLVNSNCSLLRSLMNRNISGPPRPLYVGVSTTDADYKGTANPATLFIREILATRLGDRLEDVVREECRSDPKDDIFYYSWVGDLPSESNGTCYRSTVKFTVAVSPAFVIDDYDWSSGEYSTWSESRWQPFSVRLFLKGSYNYEATIFSIGATVFVASIILTYLTSRRADVLFSGRVSGTS